MNEFANQPKIYENKRVVLITGGASKWYEQAIFIIKKNSSPKNLPSDFINEAENIIESYLFQYGKNRPAPAKINQIPQKSAAAKKPRRGAFDFTLNLLMLVACIAIFAMISYRYLI